MASLHARDLRLFSLPTDRLPESSVLKKAYERRIGEIRNVGGQVRLCPHAIDSLTTLFNSHPPTSYSPYPIHPDTPITTPNRGRNKLSNSRKLPSLTPV